MIINYKNKKEKIEILFTLNEFILFIKENIKNINIYNIDIENKINELYSNLIIDDSSIAFSNLKYLIQNKMEFKFKNILTVGYWRERGHENPEEIVDSVRMSFIGPNKINYWIAKGFNEIDAKIKLSEFQKKCSNNIDYSKRINNTNINYFLNKGYSLEESKNMLSERQKTINLKKYVEKYGDEIGTELYNQKIENRNNYFGCSKKGYSNISQELFNSINDLFDNSDNFFYATNNKEYSIKKSIGNGYWLFDFTDLSNNKIIEFQGDIFHANPSKYKNDDNPHPFYLEKKSSDIWREDEFKKNDAEKKGFSIYYVWYSEYKNDKFKIIQDCINFLKN